MSKRFPITRRPRILRSGHRRASFRRRALWLIFGILYFSSAWSVVTGAEVADLIINHSQGHLLLSLKIRDAFTADAGDPATEEISSTIVFSIALYQVNNFWFDKKVAHRTATNTLKYEPLKKEYSLFRSWDSGVPMVIGALDEAGYLMTEVKDLKVVPLGRLEKDKNYQIRVRAVCQDEDTFIFGPSGCFKTDWYTVDFTF